MVKMKSKSLHCVKVSAFGVILVCIFPAFSLTSYLPEFSPNVGKCGNDADQNNSKYGHILRSVSKVKTGNPDLRQIK